MYEVRCIPQITSQLIHFPIRLSYFVQYMTSLSAWSLEILTCVISPCFPMHSFTSNCLLLRPPHQHFLCTSPFSQPSLSPVDSELIAPFHSFQDDRSNLYSQLHPCPAPNWLFEQGNKVFLLYNLCPVFYSSHSLAIYSVRGLQNQSIIISLTYLLISGLCVFPLIGIRTLMTLFLEAGSHYVILAVLELSLQTRLGSV